jgi:hypothetical protein
LRSLQVHVPISPTPSFFTMIHYLAASLWRYGWPNGDRRLVVSIGEDCEPFDVNAAHPELARYGINWRWVDREAFRRYSHFATGMDRWIEPFQADFVLMADADVLFNGDFSDVAVQLSQPLGIAGVTATSPPWLAVGDGDVDGERWGQLFALASLPPPVFDCPHPGNGIWYAAGSGLASGPVYYNFGFVLGTRDAMNAIGRTFSQDYLLAADFSKNYLAAQMGLTLSIIRNRVSYRSLPVRYNFWGDARYHQAFPSEAADMRVLHYLNGPFRKHQDADGPQDVAAWLKANEGDHDAHVQFLVSAVRKAHRAVMADLSETTA